MPNRWYVVQSKPRHELAVVQQLENHQFICYLPRFITTKRLRGRLMEVIEPLFPSYLFVQFDVDKDQWRSVNRMKGAIRLLGANEDRAHPVPKGFVEDLLKSADVNGHLTIASTQKALRKFIPGDILQVNEGIFKGFTGICDKIQKDNVVLLLTLLSGKVEVKLPLSTVEFA